MKNLLIKLRRAINEGIEEEAHFLQSLNDEEYAHLMRLRISNEIFN